MSGAANPVVIDVDTNVYRLSAVKKAAYRMSDRLHVLIQVDGTTARVHLRTKRSIDDPKHLAGEFQNEMLDQELREVVALETEGVRNLLLAQAFSATALIDPVGETADFRSDPNRIGEPDARIDDAQESL